MTALRVINGGGATCDKRGTYVIGRVLRSWRQPCRYSTVEHPHLETCIQMQGVNARWTEHVAHDCPASTTLSDLIDEHEFDEGDLYGDGGVA